MCEADGPESTEKVSSGSGMDNPGRCFPLNPTKPHPPRQRIFDEETLGGSSVDMNSYDSFDVHGGTDAAYTSRQLGV